MLDRRAAIEVEDLLKLVLALVVLWLVLEVVETVLQMTLWFFDVLPELLGLAVVVLIVLWLADRI